MATITFDPATDFIRLDESVGIQDDDTTTSLPLAFSARLGLLGASAFFPGDATRNAEVASKTFISVSSTGTITNVLFSDSAGDPLNGVDSGLDIVGGGDIYLYTDTANDNIVIGRVGGSTGDIAFAAYLQENTDGTVTLWMVTYTAIDHPDITDPDDTVSILQSVLFVGVEESLDFDLSTLASGQNNWNRFGDMDPSLPGDTFQIVLFADESGQTVNTSKGGGETTIGNSNQLMNGINPSKDGDGEGMIFTFVKNSADELLTGDLGDQSTIAYEDLHLSGGGSWSISQTQGGAPYAVATMEAYVTADDGDLTNPLSADTQVDITYIRIVNGDGQQIAEVTGSGTFTRTDGKKGTINGTITFDADGGVRIEGLLAKDEVFYETATDHNRLFLQNTGTDADNLPWDIGGFSLQDGGITTRDVGPQMLIDDAGPQFAGQNIPAVQEDALSDGIPDDASDTTIQTVNLNDYIAPGTDAPAVFALQNGTGPSLTSKGETVTYSVVGNVLTASATDGVTTWTVFTVTLAADGNLTFELKDQLDHTGAGDNETLTFSLMPFLSVTDAEGDPAQLVSAVTATVENDVPEDNDNTSSGLVQEDDLAEGNDEGDPPTDQVSGDLSNTVNTGADDPVTWAIDPTATAPAGLTSRGAAVSYSVNATKDVLTASAGGETVFTLTVNADGTWTFDLERQLDHSGINSDTETIRLDFSTAVIATDFDKDSTTLDAGSFYVDVENDIPTIGEVDNGFVDFAKGNSIDGDLNGDGSADTPNTYKFTGNFISDITIPGDVGEAIPGLSGSLVSDTEIVWSAGGTDYFQLLLNSDATYTFNVLEDPEPAILTFDFDGFPAGNQIYGVFGANEDGSSNQLLVAPDGLVLKVNGTLNNSQSTTLNSSLSDGSITALAVSNNSINPGEVLNFISVTGAPTNITVGETDFVAGNYKDGDTLSYTGTVERTGASFEVAQTTPNGSLVDMKVTAYDISDAAVAAGTADDGFLQDLSAGGSVVTIDTVTVYSGPPDAGGTVVAYFELTASGWQNADSPLDGPQDDDGGAVDSLAGMSVSTDSTGSVIITNIADDFVVEWTQTAGADLWALENVDGDGDGMDIGGFNFTEAQPTPDIKLTAEVQITDYDLDFATDVFEIVVDGTGI
jgi:T1SS-143 domain-containing protein